ncbi:MAG: FtsX-like permease family protein [Candidatus Jacksonbacteria bacterium]
MKLRSLLTVLGIGIGIGTILFLVSLGQGLQKLLIERITTAEALLTLDITPAGDGLVALNKLAVEKMGKMDEVTIISPVKSVKAKINFEGVTAGVTAHFVDENFFRLAGLNKLLASQKENGKNNNKDSQFKIFPNNQCVIASQTVLNLLSINEEPIGKSLNLQAADSLEGATLAGSYQICDILNDELSSFVYLPISAYPSDKLTFYSNLKVQVKSTVFLEKAREEILQQGFNVSALSDTVQQANKVFKVMQIILGAFGIIALTVAAIGMFNTMTIALLERTNEIGIMRAIGASRRDIWLMFLIEALIIGFLGGLVGVIVGIGLAETANLGLNLLAARLGGQSLDIFYYPLWFIITLVSFSTLVSFITGFYPARRAAHLNPLAALRYK